MAIKTKVGAQRRVTQLDREASRLALLAARLDSLSAEEKVKVRDDLDLLVAQLHEVDSAVKRMGLGDV